MGYKILEIYYVYEYQVIKYNSQTGKGGLFVDYINTFLKLKRRRAAIPGGFKAPKTKSDIYNYSGRVKESD